MLIYLQWGPASIYKFCSMKHLVLIACFVFSTILSMGQQYDEFIRKADSLYYAKHYREAALSYSEAFKSIRWKGLQKDRYNAACSWALAGMADSAFFQLNNIVNKANFRDYDGIINDKDFLSLYTDMRWNPLMAKVKQNKEKAEANFNKPVVAKLDSIYKLDQQYRLRMDTVGNKYGWESKEMKELWAVTNEKDSLNLIEVKKILDIYGWLGPDVIGDQGNQTLFLVIQHSDPETQVKYLPMMRAAVKNGKATMSSLALLEDRVALSQGKKQIYGSQIGRDERTGKYFVLPLEDPGNVDKRRSAAGLQSMADYLRQWQIIWDIEQYKKELKEKKTKRNQ